MSSNGLEFESGRNEEGAGHLVTVSVDNVPHHVRRGAYLVSEFKTKVKVDASLALDELIDGVLTPLADDQRISIKGGEVFFSHARTGGSS